MEREIILNFLKENDPFQYSIAKIKEKNESLKSVSSQKLAMIANQLVKEGEIYRMPKFQDKVYSYYYSKVEKEGFKKRKSILTGKIDNYLIKSFKIDKDNFVVISEKTNEPKIFNAYDEFDAIVKYIFKYTNKKSVARNDFEYHYVSEINFSYEI